jgi:hypothetical protein
VVPSAPSVRLAPQPVEPVAPGKLLVATKRVTVKILAKKHKRVKLTKLLANGLVASFRKRRGGHSRMGEGNAFPSPKAQYCHQRDGTTGREISRADI